MHPTARGQLGLGLFDGHLARVEQGRQVVVFQHGQKVALSDPGRLIEFEAGDSARPLAPTDDRRGDSR